MISSSISLEVAVHEQAKKGTAQLSVLLQFDVRILSHLRPRLEIILLNFGSHKNTYLCVCTCPLWEGARGGQRWCKVSQDWSYS